MVAIKKSKITIFRKVLKTNSTRKLKNKFKNYFSSKATPRTNGDSSVAYVLNFNYLGTTYEAAMSMGHGILSGLCGECF